MQKYILFLIKTRYAIFNDRKFYNIFEKEIITFQYLIGHPLKAGIHDYLLQSSINFCSSFIWFI